MTNNVSKEVIDNFKKNEYGKKIYKCFNISLIVSIVLFVISCIIFFAMGAGNKYLNRVENLFQNIVFFITSVSILFTGYFNGKKAGALGQYIRGTKKTKNK